MTEVINENINEKINNLTVYVSDKLDISSNVLPKSKTTITIFDWDDTLFPSNYNNLEESDWKLLEPIIRNLLELALKNGKVFIVTLSIGNWVEYSCKEWFPELWPIVKDIPVFSQTEFLETHPVYHKQISFEKIIEENLKGFKSEDLQLISIGDNPIERMASFHVQKKYKIQVKFIKMIERPHPLTLSVQHKLLLQIFDEVCKLEKNMDVAMSISVSF